MRLTQMRRVDVTVAPEQGGWTVFSPLIASPLMFLRGDDAVEQARLLAQTLTKLGMDAEVRLHHREGDICVQAYTAHGAAMPMPRYRVDAEPRQPACGM